MFDSHSINNQPKIAENCETVLPKSLLGAINGLLPLEKDIDHKKELRETYPILPKLHRVVVSADNITFLAINFLLALLF